MPSSCSRPVEHPPADEEESSSRPASTFPASDYDEWEMEERLRHLDRIYARSPLRSPLTTAGSHHFRFDAQHASVPREQPTAAPQQESTPTWTGRLGRLSLAFGLAITVCGGCLMAWSHYGARVDLMPIGIPIAVVGQVFLLIGLVLQFDSYAGPSRPVSKARTNRSALPTKNANLRLDDGADSAPELTDLAARLEELSRRLDEREERSAQ